MPKKHIPVLVRVIALLNILSAIFGVLLTIAMLSSATLFANIPGLFVFGFLGGLAALGAFIPAVIAFLIGRGLYKGRNWARIVTIIETILWTLSLIPVFVVNASSTVGVGIFFIIGVLLTLYFLFNKNVRIAFGRIASNPTPSQPATPAV